MELQQIDITKIKPFKNNNKTHPARQVEMIKESINEFGFRNPIIIDKDFEVIAGHGRLLAAKALGMFEVPCIVVTDLSDEKIRAYRLLDNRLADLSEYDIDNITFELLEVGDFQLGTDSINDLFKSIIEIDGIGEGGEEKYTRKIEPPIYEPSGKIYEIKDIYNKDKYNTFMEKLSNLDIDRELKEFLELSATRHIEFSFEKIADYYANCDNLEIKSIFQDLALVIIDFEKAIELGYVEVSKKILELTSEDE